MSEFDTRTQAVISELEEQNTWLRTRAALLAGELAEARERLEEEAARDNGKVPEPVPAD